MRITCGKVQLRLIQPRQANQLLRLAQEERLTEYLQWQPHASIDDSLAWIRDTHELWDRRAAFLPGIFDTERGELVGAIGISHLDRPNRRAEVGTWIGLPFQGAGYNLPAKAAIFELGFRVLGLHRLELVVRTDNERSITATARLPGVLDEGVQHARIWRGDTAYDARMFAVTSAGFAAADYPDVRVEGSIP